MSEIDPQEFGRLQAHVQTLLESDKQKTILLQQLADDMTAVRLQLAEAGGGWKMLLMIGGAAATAGGIVTAVLQKFFRVIG